MQLLVRPELGCNVLNQVSGWMMHCLLVSLQSLPSERGLQNPVGHCQVSGLCGQYPAGVCIVARTLTRRPRIALLPL